MYAHICVIYRFLGYDMHSGNPMQGAEWCLQLTALRDAAVDSHIAKNKPQVVAFELRSNLMLLCMRASLAI